MWTCVAIKSSESEKRNNVTNWPTYLYSDIWEVGLKICRANLRKSCFHRTAAEPEQDQHSAAWPILRIWHQCDCLI